jgi:hypothetical protein
MNMRKVLLAGFSVLSMTLSLNAFAGTRAEVAAAASNLSQTAYELTDFAENYGYPHTAQHLGAIAEHADRLEIAARFGTLSDAQKEVVNVVKYYIGMRKYVNNIPYISHRLFIKSKVRLAINQAGFSVFGNLWQPLYYSVGNMTEAQQETLLDQEMDGRANLQPTGEDFPSDSGAGGNGGGVDPNGGW